MKRWIAVLLAALLALWQAPVQAQGRVYSQAELEALLAPVALYPDAVLSHILVAATRPHDLREAAAWSRANPHLSGEQAVAAAEPLPWHPSVKALLAFPDLLARMDESPQWSADLGAAFIEQEPYVMDTVQTLRRRAKASGALHSDEHYVVQDYGPSIAVYPAQPHVVYLPYYNPYVVYGPWWHSYRPVHWRPWHPRPPVRLSAHFFSSKVDWHRRHVVRQPQPVRRTHQSPAHVTIHNHAHRARPIIQGARIEAPRPAPAPSRARREQREHRVEPHKQAAPRANPAGIFQKPDHRVRPIVESAQPQAEPRERHRFEQRGGQRLERPGHRSEPRGGHRQGGQPRGRQQHRRG